MNPIVSVILPVYNDARRLPRSVGSIRDQSFADWELTIVDDGSTDDSYAVATSLASEDDRIQVLSQPHAGHATARNLGMAHARGDWLAVQDSDDYSDPRRLERQLAFLEDHPSVGVVGTYGYRVSSTGRRLGIYDIGPSSVEEFRSAQRRGEIIRLIHSSMLVRRDLAEQAGGYPLGYPMGADSAYINLRLAPLTDIVALPERRVSVEIRPDSISRVAADHGPEVGEVIRLNVQRVRSGLPELPYEEALQLLGDQPLLQRLLRHRRRRRRSWYTRGAASLASGSPRGAVPLLLAFAVSPGWVGARLWSQVAPMLSDRFGTRSDDDPRRER